MMAEKPADTLTDHEYDGIREYDNPTPGWWTMLFWGCILFSIIYFVALQLNYAYPTREEQYDAAKAANMRLQFAEIGDLKPDEATMLEYMGKPKWLSVGEMVFKQNCAVCHGQDGSGISAPNQTDDYYKNIRKLTDIPRVIANGAANGAMPAWKTRLNNNEIVLTACYIASLRGKNLHSDRGPEGEPIPPWPPIPEATTQPESDKAGGP